MNSKKSFVVVANKMLIVTVLFWGISLRASTTNKPIEKESQETEKTSQESIFERVAQYVEDEKKATADEISALEKEIADNKETIRRLSKGMGNFTQEKRKRVTEAVNECTIIVQEKLKKLKNGQKTIPPTLPCVLDAELSRVGQIGSFTYPEPVCNPAYFKFSYKIFQVIDDNNLLLNIYFITDSGEIISDKPTSVWVTGISTLSLVDDMEYCPPGVFFVAGTKRYTTTIGGSRTVFILQPIDIESLKKEYENQIKNKQNNKKASR